MKRYDKYKDSSIRWLKQIPECWSEVRLAGVLEEVKDMNKDDLFNRAYQFRYGSLVLKKQLELNEDTILTYRKYTILKADDIVINGLNLNYDFRTQRVAFSPGAGIITSAYISMTSKKKTNARYLYFLLKSMDDRRLLNGMGTGIRLTLSFEELKKQYIPNPSINEQEQIVRYLDWKVSLINKFIKAKKREVALLKELKNAEINHAVTRGLNPNIPLKDSGIKWIGQVPAHWKPFRIKQIARFNPSIQHIVKDYINEDQVVFLPMDKISSNGEIDNSEKRPIGVVRNGFTSFKRNDIVIAKITPCFENGKCALLSDLETIIGYGTTELIVIEPKNDVVINRYLLLILRSEIFRKNGANFMTGSAGQKRIPVKYIEDFSIGIPSVPEQQQIIDYIAEKEERINKAISDIEREIDLVKEYKARLISDVVTGKVDVRGIVVPDFQSDQSESEVIEATEEEVDDQTEIN